MSYSQELAMCTAKMCNILYKHLYQCVDNLIFKLSQLVAVEKPSINTFHCNKVVILQNISKCQNVNQEMVNICLSYNNSFDTTV